MSTFMDRLDPQTYESDEPVSIGIDGPSDKGLDWKIDIPQSLFERISHLAEAYKLHLLPTIDIYSRTQLNQTQAATLCEELEFLDSLTTDKLAKRYIHDLLNVARQCTRNPHAVKFVIEGP